MERDPESNEALAQMKDMFCGVFAGGMSKLIEYPFDTLKVLCQINNDETFSTMQYSYNVIKNEGIFRVYRGLSAPLFGSMLEFFVQFWLFGSCERFLKKHQSKKQLNMFEIGLCGSFSGIGVGFALTPVEFVKCQMQSSETAIQYRSTLHCFFSNLRYSPSNLLCGLSATCLREIPGSMIYFLGYRGTTRTLNYLTNNDMDNNNTPQWIVLCGGAMAGISFWSAIFPIDLIKSRIQTRPLLLNLTTNYCQTQTTNLNLKQPTILSALYQRWMQYGFKSLYNGFSITLPRAIIGNATVFCAYETSRNYLDSKM